MRGSRRGHFDGDRGRLRRGCRPLRVRTRGRAPAPRQHHAAARAAGAALLRSPLLAIPALLAIGLLPAWWARTASGPGAAPATTVAATAPDVERPLAAPQPHQRTATASAMPASAHPVATPVQAPDAGASGRASRITGRGRRVPAGVGSARPSRRRSRRSEPRCSTTRTKPIGLRSSAPKPGATDRSCASPASSTTRRTTFTSGRRPTATGSRSIPIATACAASTSPTPTARTCGG